MDQMRNLVILVAIAGGAVPPAAARPIVAVDGVPLSAPELEDAIAIRAKDADVEVRVSRDPAGGWVVDAGGRRQAIAVPRAGATRVVAMVVISLLEPPPPPAVELDMEEPPGLEPAKPVAPAAPLPPPSRLELRFIPTLLEDPAANVGRIASASLAYRVSSAAFLVATAGIGTFADGQKSNTFTQYRLGIESRYSAFGLELGGLAIPFTSSCGPAPASVIDGVYGALRAYVPLTGTTRFVIEGGGYYLGERHYNSMCWGPLEYQSRAGWYGAGVAWSL